MEEKVLSSKENYNCIIKEIIKKNSENNDQRNNLQSSQEYLDINDNEMEEIP